ncbi:hypothetical protein E2F46_06145 [Luteimonas aestuarii]|uniref:Uncharacterized protein n=1 Tax=Luteimonas aestuarii TaxID=453837 RepID=A0A4R5TY98_9GAMM|nr:hypothetical protein [Luteimonas aestuarii]TDK26175.1 hypothetical protein E2F46_06145 [Luteimonas aestuarii]
MSARKRNRQKGRREGGSFLAIPHAVLESENWKRCSGTAAKLLIDIAGLYRGKNNGDLAPALIKRPASEAKVRALRELVHYGLLVQTKHGGLGMPSLYALTWHAIDHCGGHLEVAATTTAPGFWREERPKFVPPETRKPLRKSNKPASIFEAGTSVEEEHRFGNRTFKRGFSTNAASETEHLSRSTNGGAP